MKLAEALIERADLKTKLRSIESRLMNNAKVQEGLEPSEDPKKLIEELNQLTERFLYLVVHINKTNELTINREGKTISALIAERDALTQKHKILDNFIDAGSDLTSRISHSEIRTISTFNVAETQKILDDISKQIRVTDTKIQELNWLTELI